MLCKKRKKVNFPDFFKIDNIVVTGTTSIANKLTFFLQILDQIWQNKFASRLEIILKTIY